MDVSLNCTDIRLHANVMWSNSGNVFLFVL